MSLERKYSFYRKIAVFVAINMLVQIFTPTGVQATSSLGSLVLEIGVPLTGVSATSATGTIAPTEMSIGLTGQEAISSVGDVIIIGFQDVNIVGNTNYSDVDVVGETSYTDVTHVA